MSESRTESRGPLGHVRVQRACPLCGGDTSTWMGSYRAVNARRDVVCESCRRDETREDRLNHRIASYRRAGEERTERNLASALLHDFEKRLGYD